MGSSVEEGGLCCVSWQYTCSGECQTTTSLVPSEACMVVVYVKLNLLVLDSLIVRNMNKTSEAASKPVMVCLTTFPQCNFSLEFPEIPSQNLLSYNWLGIPKQFILGYSLTCPTYLPYSFTSFFLYHRIFTCIYHLRRMYACGSAE